VREVDKAAARARIIRLDLAGRPFPFEPGQAVMVGLAGSPLKKPYSIASAPGEARRTGAIELLTQVEDMGGLDPHLERAGVGDPIDVEGPFGTFGLPAVMQPTLLIAGGTGIAPLRSMLVDWLEAGARGLSLVYSARSSAEFAYRDELESLSRGGRLRTFYTVTRDDPGWPGHQGRIDPALLREALPSPDARCVVCGPSALIDEVRELLPGLGISLDHLFTQQA
jgi:benzoate/toluate 1,2-dioxygenase reductase subunit